MASTSEQPQQMPQDNPWLAGLGTVGGRLSVLATLLGGIGLVLDKFFGVLQQITRAGPWVDIVVAAVGARALVYYYQIVRRLKAVPPRQIAAFIGPASFTQADREKFFGREAEIDDLCHRISEPDSSVCTLFGQSGCGKTSLVRAGVLPEIERRFNYKGVYVRLYNRPNRPRSAAKCCLMEGALKGLVSI